MYRKAGLKAAGGDAEPPDANTPAPAAAPRRAALPASPDTLKGKTFTKFYSFVFDEEKGDKTASPKRQMAHVADVAGCDFDTKVANFKKVCPQRRRSPRCPRERGCALEGGGFMRSHLPRASLLAQSLAKAHSITVATLDSKKPLSQPLVQKRWLLHGCDVLSAYMSTAVLAYRSLTDARDHLLTWLRGRIAGGDG